jgi:FkbM family methyltransferase
MGRTIAYEGGFERLSLERAIQIMLGGGTFLDVGCNFGIYTMLLGARPGVRCIAVDGSFVALSSLQRNLALNPGLDVTLVSSALGSETGLVRFHIEDQGNLGSTRAFDEGRIADSSTFWTVATRLNDVLSTVPVGEIRLMKIDVEGSEMSVFRGLDFDGPYRPAHIIAECYSDEFPEAAKLIDYLLEREYEAMDVTGKPVVDRSTLPEHNVWFRSTRRAR